MPDDLKPAAPLNLTPPPGPELTPEELLLAFDGRALASHREHEAALLQWALQVRQHWPQIVAAHKALAGLVACKKFEDRARGSIDAAQSLAYRAKYSKGIDASWKRAYDAIAGLPALEG